MKNVLEFVLKNITTVPDEVKIEERDEEGLTNYVISVHPDDVGRIIGKEGKVIKAIRTIMRVIAIQKGVRVRVSVLSDNDMNDTGAEPEVIVTDTEMPASSSEELPAVESSESAESASETTEVVPPTDEITVEV
ncbi:MAG: hypothetical protein UY18_C0024G0012 [Microgenomates group bacterium GW2011_GWF2_47_9]|nr:MAG: hypothetical protein UY18_C0024G0012 [Microgenomates group bacterium GW2011_GWF2_47_9]